MWECIVKVWAWLNSNSGQIQIIIAVAALIYAWKAYRKVLKQIKISDRQTDLSLQQTNISIAQMDKLNNERLFELRLRLKIRVGEQLKTLSELQEAQNALSSKLQGLSIDTQANSPGSLDAIKNMEKLHRENLVRGWDFIRKQQIELKELSARLVTISDISLMESILEDIEHKIIECNSMWRGIKNMNETVDMMWVTVNGMSPIEALRRKNKLN